jgi:hypothetical protein
MSPEEAVEYEFGLNFTVYDPSIGEVSGNLTDFCEWYKIPYSRAYQRLRKGWSIEEVLGLDSQHEHLTVNEPVVVDGEQYASFRAACDHFGVSYKLAWRRHKKRSWSIEQAMGVANPPSSVKHGGQKVRVGKRVFKTKASAMRALHIGYKKLLKGIAQGKYELVDE